MRSSLLLLLALAACERTTPPLAPSTSTAMATSAGGRIAFSSSRDGNAEIYVMNADGSGVTRLTNDSAPNVDPAWSPDGSRIVFASGRDGNYEIYVMNADGTGQTRLTNNSINDRNPAWCGTRIAFQGGSNFYDLFVMNDDGTGVTQLTNDAYKTITRESPTWSPSCDRIAYSYALGGSSSSIEVMNPDGSGKSTLVAASGVNRNPAWSPDGGRIAFASNRDDGQSYEIYVMNADGTQQTRLTVNSAFHYYDYPAWSSDGTQIAFQALLNATPGIYVMNTDGSGAALVADSVGFTKLGWFGPAAPPNQPPVAAFTFTCSNLACNFTSTSSDPDDSIATYRWTFGDGSADTVQNPSHTYAAIGTYTVTLFVTDTHGATSPTSQSVTATTPDQPPVASFTTSCTGLACDFTSTSSDSDGSITAYRWDFGDGTIPATTQNASHTFYGPGTYTVSLQVTDNLGVTSSTAQAVTVAPPNQPPTATFTVNCERLACDFADGSSDPDGSVVAWSWSFGDGATSSVSNPSHSYAARGTYTVTLVATDDRGARSTAASQSVRVTRRLF